MFSLGEATVQIIGLQKVLEDMKSEEKKDKPTLDYSQDFQKMHAHIAELQKTNAA